jgi:hypothetical protein
VCGRICSSTAEFFGIYGRNLLPGIGNTGLNKTDMVPAPFEAASPILILQLRKQKILTRINVKQMLKFLRSSYSVQHKLYSLNTVRQTKFSTVHIAHKARNWRITAPAPQ